MIELRDIAGELLSECERNRVLQMGATNFYDRTKGLGLLGKRLLETRDARKELLFERGHRGHVHRGGEHVVRRLPAVDVVVGVHESRFSPLAPEDLAGTVGEHL